MIHMQVSPGTGDGSSAALVATLVSAAVALVVLTIERIASAVARRRELRRRGLEEWLSTLAIWIDEHRQAKDEPSRTGLLQHYLRLTNRPILELRFKRKQRYVAWWMHEMALAIIDPLEWRPAETYHDADDLFSDVGEHLLKWHHGQLRSRDFHLPYALLEAARKQQVAPSSLAVDVGLPGFESPQRMTRQREQQIAALLQRPDTGKLLLEVIGRFAGRRNVYMALGRIARQVAMLWPQIWLREADRSLAMWRLKRTKKKLDEVEKRLAESLRSESNSPE